MTNNKIAFTNQQIDAAYINSLVDLVNACQEQNVKIDKVFHYQHGWVVTFDGYPHADAICHSGSYGSPCYRGLYEPDVEINDWNKHGNWETMGFPWDYDDVSMHTTSELAYYIAALKRGEAPWDEDNYEVE